MLFVGVLHQQELVGIAFLGHIALVVDVMVNGSGFGRISTRKVLEIKAFLFQLLATGKAFAVRVQFDQDVVVARQDAVDSSNHVDLLVRFFVIVAVAARVAAEFLVHAANDGLAAIEAFLFLFLFHISVVLLSFGFRGIEIAPLTSYRPFRAIW